MGRITIPPVISQANVYVRDVTNATWRPLSATQEGTSDAAILNTALRGTTGEPILTDSSRRPQVDIAEATKVPVIVAVV